MQGLALLGSVRRFDAPAHSLCLWANLTIGFLFVLAYDEVLAGLVETILSQRTCTLGERVLSVSPLLLVLQADHHVWRFFVARQGKHNILMLCYASFDTSSGTVSPSMKPQRWLCQMNATLKVC